MKYNNLFDGFLQSELCITHIDPSLFLHHEMFNTHVAALNHTTYTYCMQHSATERAHFPRACRKSFWEMQELKSSVDVVEPD